jgi:predicted Zn-dependent protease
MKLATSVIRPLAAAVTAFAVVTSTPVPALACGGEWFPAMQVDPRIKGVDKAEDAFEEGRILAAAGSVVRMIPHIKQLKPTRSKLIQRAERVLALAVARFDGALPVEREVPTYVQGTWIGRTEAERAANLEWAAGTLREIDKAKKSDPASRTELAEALSRLEGGRDEARAILEDLATKDLITSPEGYAALARLRERAGDDAGRRAALERCRSMAHGATVCDGLGAPAATT